MEPTLNINDVVIVKTCKPEELLEGDIITFVQEGRTVSHRILYRLEEDGKLKFQTKGDNNESPDNYVIDGSQIYGKMVFKINGIGELVQYVQNVNGLINGLILVLIVFALIGLRDKKKNTRKMERRKYEIKKIRDSYNR